MNLLILLSQEGEEMTKKILKSYEIASLIDNHMKNSDFSGQFRKTIFHVHTPESHDYVLINADTQELLGITKKSVRSWRDFTSEELIKIAKYVKLFISEKYIIEDLKKYKSLDLFESENELLAFMIQAHIILREEIELCLVCDHNSTNGFKKLQKAIYILRSERSDYNTKPRIELGIEISCSDKNHVVGILNQSNNEQIKEFKKWMKKNIISPSEGTVRTTFDVFEMFNRLRIIGYIAHINTSQIFKSDFLSGTYKKELFNSELFNIIGVTSIDQIENTTNRIQNFTKRKFNFVIDNDSHTIEGLKTNFFYVKGNKMDFKSIEAAIKDFNSSISYKRINSPQKYIKAIYIAGLGFLKGKKTQHMILNFSPHFNSIIGGRGTGKSTILNTIGCLTSQVFETKDGLGNILEQGTCCVLYHFEGIDYYIFLFSINKDNNEIFINNYFEKNSVISFKKTANYESQKRKIAIRDRIQVFTYDGKKTIEVKPTKKILDKLFTRKFTVNELVNIASNEEYLTDFIQSTIYEYKAIKTKKYNFRFKNGIDDIILKYRSIPNLLNKRKENVYLILKEYNSENSKKLKINFSQKKLSDFQLNWYSVLGISPYSGDRYFENYAITYEKIIDYLQSLSDQMTNGIEVCISLWNSDYDLILNHANPENYFEELTYENINNIRKVIKDKKEKIEFLKTLRIYLLKNSALNYLQDYLSFYYNNSDFFELEFNINNREHVQSSKSIFKNIVHLSLGQKVVAILSFLLSFSEFTNDNSPFIVDQPEDNLDNQYIYKNLVDDLKKMKLNRQVILASHNSTIVMNSGSEQVIVMDSDNEHGWPISAGYMAEDSIVNNVINILEGGKDAFADKAYFYNHGLKKQANNFINNEIINWNTAFEEVTLELLSKIEGMSIQQLKNTLKLIEELDVE